MSSAAAVARYSARHDPAALKTYTSPSLAFCVYEVPDASVRTGTRRPDASSDEISRDAPDWFEKTTGAVTPAAMICGRSEDSFAHEPSAGVEPDGALVADALGRADAEVVGDGEPLGAVALGDADAVRVGDGVGDGVGAALVTAGAAVVAELVAVALAGGVGLAP